MAIILPAERDLRSSYDDETLIRDADAMRVAAEIGKTFAGPPKGGLA